MKSEAFSQYSKIDGHAIEVEKFEINNLTNLTMSMLFDQSH